MTIVERIVVHRMGMATIYSLALRSCRIRTQTPDETNPQWISLLERWNDSSEIKRWNDLIRSFGLAGIENGHLSAHKRRNRQPSVQSQFKGSPLMRAFREKNTTLTLCCYSYDRDVKNISLTETLSEKPSPTRREDAPFWDRPSVEYHRVYRPRVVYHRVHRLKVVYYPLHFSIRKLNQSTAPHRWLRSRGRPPGARASTSPASQSEKEWGIHSQTTSERKKEGDSQRARERVRQPESERKRDICAYTYTHTY